MSLCIVTALKMLQYHIVVLLPLYVILLCSLVVPTSSMPIDGLQCTLSRLEIIVQKCNVFLRKWLGLPRIINTTALYKLIDFITLYYLLANHNLDLV